MQRFSEQDLEQMAMPYLTEEITEVFATTDGQVFYDINRASQHATERSLTVYAFSEAASSNELSGNKATLEPVANSQEPTAETEANRQEPVANSQEPTAETEAIGQKPTAETANEPTAETGAIGQKPTAETANQPTAETEATKQESPLPEAHQPEAKNTKSKKPWVLQE